MCILHVSHKLKSSYGNETSYSTLQIEENELTGTIPSQLGNQRRLFELNLCKDTNIMNKNMCSRILTHCMILLAGNMLKGTIPSKVGQRNSLQLLHLGEQ